MLLFHLVRNLKTDSTLLHIKIDQQSVNIKLLNDN